MNRFILKSLGVLAISATLSGTAFSQWTTSGTTKVYTDLKCIVKPSALTSVSSLSKSLSVVSSSSDDGIFGYSYSSSTLKPTYSLSWYTGMGGRGSSLKLSDGTYDLAMMSVNNNEGGYLALSGPGTNDASVFIDGNGTSYFNAGNVGIGTTNPGTYKLAVEGKIGAREIVVTTASWADHVFKPNYDLKPLNEVEKFIKENNHLEGIPTEKEVKENGVAIGDMQTKLLQKVEELTLYVIDQNKKIDQLSKANEELKIKLNAK